MPVSSTSASPVTAVLTGSGADRCLAIAHQHEAILLCPLERWRRRPVSRESFGRDFVRTAMAALLPEPLIPTTEPHLVDLSANHDATAALLAAARLYAGRRAAHALVSRGHDGVEWWTLDEETTTRLIHLEGPAPDVVLAAFASGLGLDYLPATQIEALARWGEPTLIDDVAAAHADRSLDRLAARWRDHNHRHQADAVRSLQHVLAAPLSRITAGVTGPVVLLGKTFLNSYFTTAVAAGPSGAPQSESPKEIIIPPDPGTGSLAVGALALLDAVAHAPSPFCGPSSSVEDTKLALDSCKLTYELPGEAGCISRATDALKRGHLVAWFEQGMEWGPRALGHRSILADASNPYVLENLNVYLKKRPAFMSYALSVRANRSADVFNGPAESPGMQFEYTARDPDRFTQFLPRAAQSFRVQTVTDDGSSLARLLEAVESTTGLPYLANTSFNAITEPLVATPTDAIRCFFGSGLDLLVINGLVVTK